jgi:predicted ATP-grasp superfamily ATP-dependent carboligase
VDPDLEAAASRLFGLLGWWGLAQLQLRMRPDGPPVLIDFNPRFYGSLALAEHAGVNLPAAWAGLVRDEPVPGGRGRPGRRYQWLEGDVRSTLMSGDRTRAIRLAGVAAYALRSGHTAWRRDDPRPALRVAARTVRRIRNRLLPSR